MKRLAQGAEAKLYLEKGKVLKERVEKTYRIKEIDARIRKIRTKKEAKILEELNKLGFTPKLLEVNGTTIQMEYLEGPKIRDIIGKKNYKTISKEIGRKIRELHNHKIIHGDLTTSNMIMKDQIYFIDFGLSFTSAKVEDKAVDLHLLKQALESKHYEISKDAFKEVLKAYSDKDVIKRLEQVEKRGRYKGKH